MRISRVGKTVGLLAVSILTAFATREAHAQRHHHHDAAGHMIDHAGHHTNGYGGHTGQIGVYDNQYGPMSYVYQQPAYMQSYVGASNYYSPTPVVVQTVPSNVVPQNVIPYSIQSNAGAMIPIGGPITILNPADSGGDIKYALNGTPYSIKPGYTQTVPYDRTCSVEFGSGGPAGNIRYSLQPGTYKFKVTEAGWNLFKAQEQSRIVEVPAAPLPDLDPIGNGPRPGLVPVN